MEGEKVETPKGASWSRELRRRRLSLPDVLLRRCSARNVTIPEQTREEDAGLWGACEEPDGT